MYGSFQANMMALALAYLQLALYFSSDLRVTLPAALLLSALCHLAHPWTALQILGAVALLAVARRGRREALLAVTMAAGVVVADCVRSSLAPAGHGTAADVVGGYLNATLTRALGNLLSLPRTMHFAVTTLYGGFMNYPLLALALAGLLLDRDELSDLLSAWAAAAAIAYFSTWSFASRALLNLPTHVMAARAVARLRGAHLWAAVSLSLSYYAMCVMNLVPPRAA
ncbi:MAG: hypothetical protein DRJ56_03345 [Thermoprotei archaeon]|nr:MAG: hypothetical protein DRJ56_03345 [Thermoprotei archaeon]